MDKRLLFGLLALGLLSLVPGLVQAGLLDDLVCPQQHMSKYETCAKVVNPLYVFQSANDKPKANCCSLIALRDCSHFLSTIICGSGSFDLLGASADFTKTLSLQCIGIDSITDCVSPWILLFFTLMFLWLVIGCIKCCCCPSTKTKVRIVLDNKKIHRQPLLNEV